MVKSLVWAGAGARGHDLEQYGVPVVLTWGGADLLPTDHPLNAGIVGVSGQPGANKAVLQADEILVIGSGVHQTQTAGYKLPQVDKLTGSMWDISEIKKQNEMPKVGSYLFNNKMTRLLPAGSVMVVDGGGTALYTGFQSSYIKEGSRLICSTAISAMGSGLPEAVGACVASGRLTTCLIGDGSLMLNLQELQTIRHHNLPIKIFVLNNNGYLAIKHTQDGFLGGRRFGVGGPDVSFPKTERIAHAFNIPYCYMEDPYDGAENILGMNGPFLCEVFVPEDQQMVRQGFKKEGDKFIPMNLGEMACAQ